MKEGFVLRKWKIYPWSREEREEMHKFIEKQLRKEYIRPLKSPQTALVFFVGTKDSKKCMVQNYGYLNEQTIKNNYLLSFISNIVENIGTKKVFTNLDLQQNYNYIWIKKENESKVAFMTWKGLFELTVMFCELTNSPVIFQTMMNKILQNLINTGVVASFIDDVIVVIEEEEGYNEIVEEVVRRLVTNDLYVKPEKCN